MVERPVETRIPSCFEAFSLFLKSEGSRPSVAAGCRRALPECCSEGYYEGGGGLKRENLEVQAEEQAQLLLFI
jgi:hypothetical protein